MPIFRVQIAGTTINVEADSKAEAEARVKGHLAKHPPGSEDSLLPLSSTALVGRVSKVDLRKEAPPSPVGVLRKSGQIQWPSDEIERRRKASIDAMEERSRQEFAAWYQEECDRLYWTRGQCCAGCDHWQSDMGMSGTCGAAGIVSGEDVLRSVGITFCSYTPPPGLPLTHGDFHCGKFKDVFDWSQLEPEYLQKIGAMKNGELREKPQHPIAA